MNTLKIFTFFPIVGILIYGYLNLFTYEKVHPLLSVFVAIYQATIFALSLIYFKEIIEVILK
jgi:hypothetical protein